MWLKILIIGLCVLLLPLVLRFFFTPIACYNARRIERRFRKLEDFIKGYLLLACPKEMTLKMNYNVSVSIGSRKEDFLSKISYYSENNISFDDFYEVRIGEVMKLKLLGNAFEITEINNDAQSIINNATTDWSWNVKPLKRGNQQLILLVSIQLNSPKSGQSYVDFPVFEKTIKVKVNRIRLMKDFFIKNWQWLLGLIVGSGLLWKILDYFTK